MSLSSGKKSQVGHCFQFCHYTVSSFVILLFEKIILFFELAHLSTASIPHSSIFFGFCLV
jgi:hypothetical protein